MSNYSAPKIINANYCMWSIFIKKFAPELLNANYWVGPKHT